MIQELSADGQTDRQIAKLLNLSIHTVRKWRRRYAQQGKAGLVSRMGRPRAGALSTYPAAMRTTVKQWRKDHPGWGPKTLRAELGGTETWAGQALPHRTTLARFLKQEGLTKAYQKHTELPEPSGEAPQACHEEWEMDARGHEPLEGLGIISLIQVNDLFSRVKLISYPCWLGDQRLTRYPATEDYQLVLRLAFTQWGLPDRLAVDRAHVFYDAQGKSPFPTRFHLWLLCLGVELTFGRPNQPRDQAMTERSHQTWWDQVVLGRSFANLGALCQALEARRPFLNECLPCETLNNRPPLVAHPEARQPRRPYRFEWERDQLDLTQACAYLGRCVWFRKTSKQGKISLGGHDYNLPPSWYDCEVMVLFDPDDRCFIFQAPPRPDLRRPIYWLTPEYLMGEAAKFSGFPTYQLALPFTWQEWRSLQILAL
jgi:transposase